MIKTGKLENDFENNDYQWWGHALEEPIAKRYEYETGEKLEYKPETVIHPALPYMLCHPDRFVVGKRKLVEIKTANYSTEEWGVEGSDQVPPAYLLQVQHQLACTGYDEADLIVYFRNFNKSQTYNIKRDIVLIAAIETAITDFWNYNVLGDIAPELTALSDCKLVFKQKLDSYIEATDEILADFSNYKDIKKVIKGAEQMLEHNQFILCSYIGETAGLKHGDKILATWKADKNGKRTFRPTEK